MIKIKYIEDYGQTYTDCVVEIFNMQLVTISFAINRKDFFFVNHTQDQLDKIPSRMYPVSYRRLHTFNYSTS
jgi:hypothetical protein